MSKSSTKKKILIISIITIALLLTGLVSVLLINLQKETKLSDVNELEAKRYLAYNEITDNNANIDNCEYVKFNSFFTKDLNGDGYAEKYDGTCNELNKKATLYFDINVLTEGKLENGKISIQGKNFNLSTSLVKDDVILNDYISSNTKEIGLTTINNGTQKLFSGTISANIGNNINNYSITDNKVILTGTWVSSDGNTRKDIRKEITLKTDWYGKTTTVPYRYTIKMDHDIKEAVGTEDITFKFSLGYEEIAKELIIQKQVTEVTISQFNGYDPISAKTISTNATSTFENGILTIERTAKVDANGNVTSSVSRSNVYEIEVKYPLEAYTTWTGDRVGLVLPTKGYYYGFNNISQEFASQNPYISQASKIYQHSWSEPHGEVAIFYVYTGTTVSDPSASPSTNQIISKEMPLNIYNNIENEEGKLDTYPVRWRAATGNASINDGVYMQANGSDNFLNSSGQTISMENYVHTKGIYFTNFDNMLERENAWIKVYDKDTKELLATFTNDDWNKYSESKPYEFSKPVKSIRIETSKAKNDSYAYVNLIKEIDDEKLTTDFTRAQFDNLDLINSYLEGGLLIGGKDTPVNTSVDDAHYEAPVSTASFEVKPSQITNQETKNTTLKITTSANRYNEKKWSNGQFVIEMPEEILEVELQNIKCSNSNVEIISSEVYEGNGKQYIRIYTKNDTPETYNIEINANITADPRKPTSNKLIKLYAINTGCHNYRDGTKTNDILDINNNSNTVENVLYKTVSISIIAPSSLLTAQTLSDFDDSGTVVVSPQTAILDKVSNARDANINVTITNNYSGTISETIIIGKIPFQGNTYQINGKELGSTYSVSMKNTGITLPSTVASTAKVYYSTNTTVNKNITDTSNNWKTADQVTDWNQVKCYAIDLGSYALQKKEALTFTYGIVIPANINYNDISYSTHGIYFCLDTEDGKLGTQTEVNRLGIMIAKKFDISLTKYKQGTNTKVAGATYKITDGINTRTGTTNNEGKATISGLYVDKEYTLKEIASPDSYVLNEDEVKFKITVDASGLPQVVVTQGNLRDAATITNAAGVYTLNLSVEDIAKYDLNIIKKDKATGEVLKGVKFRLTGGTYGDFGRIFTTNADGNISMINLVPGTTYTLQETKATGYYVNQEPITFNVVRNATGNLSITSNNSEIQNANINEQEGTAKAIISANVTNEKISTYSLNINKNDKDNNKLAGTQFKLSSTDTGEELIATTDEQGIATFDGIYQYVTGKYITGEYTLEEIVATEGYVTDTTKVKFKAEKDTNGILQITILEGESLIKTHTSNSTSITFNIENKPIFKLTKTDDNGTPLANAKFKITDLNENPATDANGNPIGELEGILAINLEFASVSTGNAAWTQKPDRTWVSGNKGVQSSNSTMASKPFTLSERRTLSFEWCQSSEISFDYIIYTIKNADGSTFKTENAKSKFNNTNKYDNRNLQFATIEVPLPAGTYTIEFTYTKDGSGDQGDDAGYVRNAKIDGNGYYAVTTNENGEITANLPEGLYQIEEMEAPEGFELPANVEDRIHYVGIGKSKPEETTFGTKFTKAIKGVGHSMIYDMKATNDGGYIVAGCFAGECDINADGIVDITAKGDTDAYMVKFNKDGEYEWHYILGTIGADKFKRIDLTADGGYVAIGYEYSSTYRDSVIVKINNSGTQVWKTKPVTVAAGKNAYDDELTGVKVLPNGNIVITGNFYGEETKVGTTVHTNTNQRHQGFIAWLNANGTYIKSVALTGTDVSTDVRANVNITDVTLTNRGIVVSVDYVGKLNVNGTELDTTTNQQDTVLIGYSVDGIYQWHTPITGTNTESIGRIITDNEDNIVALGGFGTNLSLGGETITAKTENISNAMMLKFANEGQYVPNSAYVIGASGTYRDNKFTSAAATSDGGLLIGGWFYSVNIDVNGDGTNDITNKGKGDGIVIKLKEDGIVEWAKQIGGSAIDATHAVAELKDGTYVGAGNFNSTALTVDNTANALTMQGAADAFMVGFGKVVTAAEVPQTQTIEVINESKKFKITTEIDVNSEGQRAGGTITGTPTSEEYINFVEEVSYGYNSKTPIVITPDANYSVYKITINDEEVQFTPGANGVVTLPIFEDVKHNYHIKVIFERNISSVLVHHYLKDRNGNLTTTKLAEDEVIPGKIGSNYTTSPKTDIEINGIKYNIAKTINNTGYEVVGNYALPKNRAGKYTASQTVVTYYYEELPFTLTVHHYLEGTENKLAEDEISSIYRGETFETNYNTSLLTDYDFIQELTTVNLEEGTYTKDENSKVTGTINQNTEVTYYYRLEEYSIITKVNPITITRHNELTNEYTEVTVKGGSISGEGQIPYEAVPKGYDSQKEIKAVPDEGYRVKKITVKNGETEPEEITFTPSSDGSVTLNKFINVREDKEVTVEFEPIQGKVIVHHYIKGTTTPILLDDGTTAKDEEKTGYVGDIYATSRKENPAKEYRYDSVVGATTGEYIDGTIEVTYYYEVRIDVELEKKWYHGTMDHEIPDNVVIQLLADGKAINEVKLTRENKVTIAGEPVNQETWRYTITDLPKYNSSGNEIKYEVKEKNVLPEQIIGFDRFEQTTASRPWTVRADGTWESGAKGVANGVSTIEIPSTAPIVLTETRTISFEWAASSQGVGSDYLYYRIGEVQDNGQVNWLNAASEASIGGNTGATYASLPYQTVTKELPAGKYVIQFTYTKNKNNNKGLDAGFVKNLKILEK